LLDRLDAGVRSGHKLTLVSAPAGFGKTTLIGEWIRERDRVSWVSLDEADNDPVQFWTYVIAALQTVQTGIGQTSLAWLQSLRQESLQIESVLVGLVNEVAGTDGDWILVLDDFHAITEPEVNRSLVFLLDHLPPRLHVVLLTRADPPWSLARLRARGEMTELRTEDLRFTLDEVTDFLNAVMGLGLAAENVAALDSRTEGWIVGLQLAALSMQGRSDAASFIQAFGGSHRFILDYLVEEVLDRQPDDIREFLVRTSILDRLSGSLCDAVLDAVDGSSQNVLVRLEQCNLFLIPLDDERQWYRYHHLFADLLASRLSKHHPDQVPVLHRRASEWCAERNMAALAIGHALQAGDLDQVESLVKHNALALVLHGALHTLISAMQELPDEVVRSRPWLMVGFAWALAFASQHEAAEALLVDIDDSLREALAVEAVEARHISGQVAAIRCYVAGHMGDLQRSISLARAALEDLAQDDSASRSFAASLLAAGLDRAGDPITATRVLEEVIAASTSMGDLPTVIFALSTLTGVQSVVGQLGGVIETYEKARRLITEYGYPSLAVEHACGLAGGAMYHRNDLAAAERYLQESLELCAQTGKPIGVAENYLGLVRILRARGDLDAAYATMRKALGTSERVSPWFLSFARAWEALLHLQSGDPAFAVDWAQGCGLRHDDEVSRHTYNKHIILARVLVAQGEDSDLRLKEALHLLGRLVDLAESTQAGRYLIESLVVRALAYQAQGKVDKALADLARAIKLGEPEGYVRLFVDEGAPMERLLRSALSRGVATDYVQDLLSVLTEESARSALPEPQRPALSLIDPLSERELEVLRLLPTHLTSTEISQELYLSKNTVRTHISHIYDKLGVHSREDAVQRAQELGLL